MFSQSTSARMTQLRSERVPFVHATVVRAQAPTSSHAGDDAIVFSDGTMEGFVGGQCAENSVRTTALRALGDQRPTLLRILPEDDTTIFPDAPGAEVVVNPCLSGGALEIFLEPVLPATVVSIVGETPIATAMISIGSILGYGTVAVAASADIVVDGSSAGVIIASHGRYEAEAIRAALDAGVRYIALVASRKRGTTVLTEANVTPEEASRIKTPAGLQIGAESPSEVALSIMAEFVQVQRSDHRAPAARIESQQAIDPMCGMTVTIMPDTPHLITAANEYWFCNPGCRDRFAREHQQKVTG